ncbi:MAG: hypothetical protein ACTSWL_09565, partial [Promethearchaeota archaeon]
MAESNELNVSNVSKESIRTAKIQNYYLKIIQNNIHPFEQVASRHDVKDSVDIAAPHKALDRRIERFLKIIHQNHIPKIVPILGEAGTGKSHYYWILKNQELKMGSEAVWRVIYIPTPPLDIHIPLHILNCILDEQGEFLLKNTARNLLLKF